VDSSLSSAGSQLAVDDSTGENGFVIGLAAVNTIMAAAGAGLSAGIISKVGQRAEK
jgi:hypothetical protein